MNTFKEGRTLPDMSDRAALLKGIRAWLVFFVVCLVLSGATAFPLVHELRWTEELLRSLSVGDLLPALMEWIGRVRAGLDEADAAYPFLLYGTDWLAFAHLVIAVGFYGPYRDPVRNVWVVEFGMIACAGIVPLALICGPIRGIPFWWTVIDMSFGVLGVIPLYVVRQRIKRLEALTGRWDGGGAAGTDDGGGATAVVAVSAPSP
ncbi:putative cytoplasmic membrane protein [Streptomyces scabiei 87.22]|uniref:Putative cytoplasmic membrane protein n=2 Tax=Streptomyces TaxID=1883 RepID=C9Z3M0_STRSW|nr:putative cytoplasmic membrane protein [Streptomyces scabiei 87.22]